MNQNYRPLCDLEYDSENNYHKRSNRFLCPFIRRSAQYRGQATVQLLAALCIINHMTPVDDLMEVKTCSLNYVIKFDVFDVHCNIIILISVRHRDDSDQIQTLKRSSLFSKYRIVLRYRRKYNII